MGRFGTCLLAAFLAMGAAPWAHAADCPRSAMPPLALPAVRAALAANTELTVVAVGSSSTQGVRASDIAHSYPAVLQAELTAALPQAHVAVLNRGIGGQDASEMLSRLERDALAVQPALVIWQVGANGAMRRTDPEVFRKLVEDGVQRLRAAGVDVVLMDNQRAPAILASPDSGRIAQVLADVAAKAGVGLFGRGRLMDQWQEGGRPYNEFINADGVHHNDLGYRCVAKALATSILQGLTTREGVVAAAVRR